MSEIPYGYCHCGCGQKTSIAKKNDKSKGWVKGVPLLYVLYHRLGFREKSTSWKGGSRIDPYGYRQIYVGNGRVKPEHRLVAEQEFGQPLPKGAIVHHVTGNKADNTKLHVFANHAEHALHHANERALMACGHPHWRKCGYCQQYADPATMIRMGNGAHRHKDCSAATARKRKKATQLRQKSDPLA